MTPDTSIVQQLCTACGLCCNGVIFRDVELNLSDSERLASSGLPIRKTRTKVRMGQPCAALECNLCKVYANRPTYCREFECALLKRAVAGNVSVPNALRTIRSAQKRAKKVVGLLRELGNTNEDLPLSKRFKQVTRAFEWGEISGEAAGIYGDLTIAVHELNYLLSQTFYPGDQQD